ncbi:MAG: paraquat-inducible protein A [Planctomycetota bacterium]|nr:paraquat-inducible protein A [Planctomycetota bacterium]
MNLPLPTLKFAIIVSSVALGIGITAPTITITPGAGELTPLVELLTPQELEPRTYSILGFIKDLFEGGSYGDCFLGVALLIFSIIFPAAKLGFYWLSICGDGSWRSPWKLLEGIDRFGKFSMAEVFLLALIVFAVKTLPGGSKADLEYGTYVFFASVLLALLISISIKKGPPTKPAPEKQEEPAEAAPEEPKKPGRQEL